MTNVKEEGDWRKLCELAAKEIDPEKLYALVERLNRVLETRARGMQRKAPADEGQEGQSREGHRMNSGFKVKPIGGEVRSESEKAKP